MAFIDNPTIAALGNSLGLSGVFDAARGATSQPDPASSYPVPPAKPGISKPNIPPYKERPYIPHNEGPMQHVGGGVTPGMNPVTPGVMDPATLQDPNVQAMLGQYGVHPSTQPPDPNLFVHNPAAFQQHPVLAGLLEHGLEGLAYAHPGQNFFQSLVGGVQGMQEANAARAGQANAQLMAPFQQAQAIQQLQHGQDEHDTSVDNIAYHQGMMQSAAQNAQTKQERAAAIAPRKNTDGTSSSWNPNSNHWEVDPSLGVDQEMASKNNYYVSSAHQIANDKYGGDLTKLTAADHLNMITGYEKALSLSRGASNQLVEGQKAATTIKAAGIRASGGGKMSDETKAQISDLKDQEKDLDSESMRVQTSANPITDRDTGQLLVSSKARSAYIQRLQGRKAALQQRRAQLTGAPASVDTPAPKFSPSNPFAPKTLSK